jgi:hypothetical protein
MHGLNYRLAFATLYRCMKEALKMLCKRPTGKSHAGEVDDGLRQTIDQRVYMREFEPPEKLITCLRMKHWCMVH